MPNFGARPPAVHKGPVIGVGDLQRHKAQGARPSGSWRRQGATQQRGRRADLFEADAGEAADSESESIHGVGNAEFEADACQAGVNVADEGDDGQGDA